MSWIDCTSPYENSLQHAFWDLYRIALERLLIGALPLPAWTVEQVVTNLLIAVVGHAWERACERARLASVAVC